MDLKMVSKLDTKDKKMNIAFMEKIEQGILTSLRSVMDRVTSIWRELGVEEELQCVRSKSAQDLVIAFMEEIVEDEIRLYLEHVERIGKYKTELDELTVALDAEPVIIAHTMTLFQKESFLRSKVDILVKEKHTRIKMLQELKKTEEEFCAVLNLPTYKVCSEAGIPTKTSLNELENHVHMLKEERERRHKKFRIAKQELTTIMETTELVPETNFEREVICYEDDQFLLSSENLKELEKFVAKVQNKRLELEKEKTALLEKLVKLWDRLSIGDSERKDFLSNHTGYRVKAMRGFQLEIERCEEIKKQNIKSYIKIIREELQELWMKCQISDIEQKQFLDLIKDESEEDALTAYETKVESIAKYYKDTGDIFNKIALRQELWNRMIDFENKANDPLRYVNRGGTLLQEERERRKLQKDLPKLESDLFQAIECYEEHSGTKFLYDGVNFQEFVRNQWAQRLDEKESKKLERQNRRTLVTQQEGNVGTPVSKKRTSVAPNSAPSKMLRSNNGVSISRTNRVSEQLNTLDVKQKSRSKSCNNVKLTPIRASPRLTIMKKKHVYLMNKNKKSTNSSDSTTYSEFAKELSKPSRIIFHSSIISPKKVLGGKACTRMRKSAGVPNKSIQKFTKNNLKLTPVRGKLGLPFLI